MGKCRKFIDLTGGCLEVNRGQNRKNLYLEDVTEYKLEDKHLAINEYGYYFRNTDGNYDRDEVMVSDRYKDVDFSEIEEDNPRCWILCQGVTPLVGKPFVADLIYMGDYLLVSPLYGVAYIDGNALFTGSYPEVEDGARGIEFNANLADSLIFPKEKTERFFSRCLVEIGSKRKGSTYARVLEEEIVDVEGYEKYIRIEKEKKASKFRKRSEKAVKRYFEGSVFEGEIFYKHPEKKILSRQEKDGWKPCYFYGKSLYTGEDAKKLFEDNPYSMYLWKNKDFAIIDDDIWYTFSDQAKSVDCLFPRMDGEFEETSADEKYIENELCYAKFNIQTVRKQSLGYCTYLNELEAEEEQQKEIAKRKAREGRKETVYVEPANGMQMFLDAVEEFKKNK